jgi:hypothetical protein
MDTRRFSGTKAVTIFVQVTQPRFEEVRLWVQANSRDDFAVTPDTLAFGRVSRGSNPSSNVVITLLGNGQWQLRDPKSESNYVRPVLKEVRRENSEVSYELSASVRADAPVGKWYTDIWVTTDNPAMPRVRVPLTVEIESALSLSPTTVQLGQVKVGGEGERRVMVRGVKPFKIIGVTGGDASVSVKDNTQESKQVHVLTVTVKPKQVGDHKWTLQIQTDLPGEGGIELPAQVSVIATK